jgi:hypothetical protein
MGHRKSSDGKRARLVVKLMGIEIFKDPIGQGIKAKLMNYAAEHYSTPPEQLESAVDRTHLIVSAAREAIIEGLENEISIMTFRNINSESDEIPIMFIAGVLHALDVVKGGKSIMDMDTKDE